MTKRFRDTAVAAVRAGQSVIEDGWRDRVSVRTGAHRESINATAVKQSRSFVGGGVVATSPYALYREFGTGDTEPDPAMRQTIDQDGPRAEAAMIRVLERGIRG